ncbi:EFR1 family ferrodoxin [Eubacteriaceae bacterium ES2]|nr:EFR1 family ferrodoxin [Eubacteriaceae bacterium ES2]
MNDRIIKKVMLAYFSGTGGTRLVTDCFEKQLLENNLQVKKINIAKVPPNQLKDTDLLIVLSPVYACRLVSMVEKWTSNLPKSKGTCAVIISVSGGGDISPNTACRIKSKHFLKKNGYDLIYEKMLIMPSNFAIQANSFLNYSLIKILPHKVNGIIADILSGKMELSKPKLQDRLFFALGKGEHFGSKIFGSTIKTSEKCDLCGKCVRNCPGNNIQIQNGQLKFGFRCLFCMKCIYACPNQALTPRIMKFSVLCGGFDIESIKSMSAKEIEFYEYSDSKDRLWHGVINYLIEK